MLGTDHFKKTSQELRVASPQDERFRIVAGLFYQRQSNAIHQDYRVAGLSPAMSVNGLPGTLWLTQQHRVDKDYAMFGEAAFDILPNLTLTAGGRAYIYDNSLVGFFGFGRNPAGPPYNAAGSSRTGVAGCFTTDGLTVRDGSGAPLMPAVVPGGPCTNLGSYESTGVIPKETQGQGFLHKLNLTWKPIEHILFYGTWSRGYRPGGINRRGTIPPYQADFLTNYEFGWKTTLFDGLLRFNGAVYQQDWKNFQFSFLGQNSFTEIHNGPNARIRGVEADVNLTTGGLTLTASGAYTDAKTTQNLCAADDPTYTCATSSISAPKGTRLPVTPRFKANATARYSFPIGPATAMSKASSRIKARSRRTCAVARPRYWARSANRPPPISRSDPCSAISRSRRSYENAFDARAELTRTQECGNCFQRVYQVFSRPRTFGIRAGSKF